MTGARPAQVAPQVTSREGGAACLRYALAPTSRQNGGAVCASQRPGQAVGVPLPRPTINTFSQPAVASGGSIVRIELSANQGGVCWTKGGSRFLTASAGYLGSMLWGALFLLAAARTRLDRFLVALVGVFVLGVTLLYVRSGFGFFYGLAAGALLVGTATSFSEAASDALLRVIGTVSCLYAPWDIASDLLLRDVAASDAHTIATITHVPAVVWGAAWFLVATAGALYTLFLTSRRRSR